MPPRAGAGSRWRRSPHAAATPQARRSCSRPGSVSSAPGRMACGSGASDSVSSPTTARPRRWPASCSRRTIRRPCAPRSPGTRRSRTATASGSSPRAATASRWPSGPAPEHRRMDWLSAALDVFLHLDTHLNAWAGTLGPWLYVVLFVVIFCETGLVVTPFLPGDSLLFAIGALVSIEGSPLSLPAVLVLLWGAAVLGDATNYAIGHFLGRKVVWSPCSC